MLLMLCGCDAYLSSGNELILVKVVNSTKTLTVVWDGSIKYNALYWLLEVSLQVHELGKMLQKCM